MQQAQQYLLQNVKWCTLYNLAQTTNYSDKSVWIYQQISRSSYASTAVNFAKSEKKKL